LPRGGGLIKLEPMPMYSDDDKSDKVVSQKLDSFNPATNNDFKEVEDDDIDAILDKLEITRDIPAEQQP
jgi:hypothetical protein